MGPSGREGLFFFSVVSLFDKCSVRQVAARRQSAGWASGSGVSDGSTAARTCPPLGPWGRPAGVLVWVTPPGPSRPLQQFACAVHGRDGRDLLRDFGRPSHLHAREQHKCGFFAVFLPFSLFLFKRGVLIFFYAAASTLPRVHTATSVIRTRLAGRTAAASHSCLTRSARDAEPCAIFHTSHSRAFAAPCAMSGWTTLVDACLGRVRSAGSSGGRQHRYCVCSRGQSGGRLMQTGSDEGRVIADRERTARRSAAARQRT